MSDVFSAVERSYNLIRFVLHLYFTSFHFHYYLVFILEKKHMVFIYIYKKKY